MDLRQTLDDRERLVRALLAAGLAVVALRSLRSGKRLRGTLAGFGALAVGYGASSESPDVTGRLAERLDTEPTSGDAQLRCAICGEPIVAGQLRRPNEDDETVHEACLETTA